MKSYIITLGLLLVLGAGARAAGPPLAAPPIPAMQPFDLAQVSLLAGPQQIARDADRRYLLSLSTDSLLYSFRQNAGLPTPGTPLGGWEAPTSEVRGHFVGHYLSACAMMYASTGDTAIKAKADAVVAGMAQCQQTLNNNGYMAAFPTSFFDRLEAGTYVWVPYYTIHKIMAGLVDMYQYGGNTQALQVAEGMAAYFKARTDKFSDAQMAQILNVEQGGIVNTFYDLYNITQNPDDLTLAHRFEHHAFLDPLALGQDNLTGLHANTNIPKVLGAARGFELADKPGDDALTAFFWDRVANHRSYATGGSNQNEHWGSPDALAQTLASNDEETCTTYNILKVTRDLIRWTADPRYADFYERAYFNGPLA